MEILKRLAIAINYNKVLFGLATLIVLYTLTSPVVAEPILNFCFAGMVPGTTKVIDPDTMIMGEIILLGTIVIVALLGLLIRNRMARPEPVHSEMVAVPIDRVMEVPVALPPVKQVSSSTTRRPSKLRKNHDFSGGLRTIAMSLLVSIINSVQYAMYFVSWAAALMQLLVLRSLRVVIVVLSECFIITVVLIRVIIYTTRIAIIRTISWLYPRAERFDHWLELRYRAGLAWSQKRLMRFESIQVVIGIFRDSKNNLRQFFK